METQRTEKVDNSALKLVVLTGAGISAESGIRTFRDADGLWEGHNVMEVASPRGWRKNQPLVLDFYNQRRRQMAEVEPNAAHRLLQELERCFEVVVITQNVDDLHERAGSQNVIHLHGKLTEARSTIDPELVFDIGYADLNEGDLCPQGSQLRPNVVWFGEDVPAMSQAIQEAMQADIFVVIGTSMLVYPAASLIDYIGSEVEKIVVDPVIPQLSKAYGITPIARTAVEGIAELIEHLKRIKYREPGE